MSPTKREAIQILFATFIIGVGVAVYLLDRGGNVYFVEHWLAWDFQEKAFFGVLAENLPSFAHTFAFALLTATALRLGRLGTATACAFWVLINVLFEIGQSDPAAALLSRVLDDRLHGAAVFDQISNFFILGTYDALDLIGAGIGGIAAYCVYRRPQYVMHPADRSHP